MRIKLLTTLSLLLMAVSGAWADNNLYLDISSDGTSAMLKYGDPGSNPYFNGNWWSQTGNVNWDDFKEKTCKTITVDESCKNFRGRSLHYLFGDFFAPTTITGLGNINTYYVADMAQAFLRCSSLESLDLSSWNTSNVSDMRDMFDDCNNLTTIDFSSWNTSKVRYMYEMFTNCWSLTTLDLSGWNTSSVTDMTSMFWGCEKLESIYVGEGWSTTNVTKSNFMFEGCTSLPNFNSSEVNKAHAHSGADGYLNKVKVKANSDGTNYWATYYNSAHSFKADDNTTVYQAKVNGDKDAVVLTEVTSKEIPADNGVVLKSSASSIILSVATTTATYSANDLKGTDVDLANPGNVYCLSNETTGKARGVGFYSYTSANGTSGNGVIPAHRAYLEVTGVPNTSRGFLGFGNDDGATAIDNSQWKMDNSDGTIYDLSGRIVKGQPRKGIYVKNGKKFVIN